MSDLMQMNLIGKDMPEGFRATATRDLQKRRGRGSIDLEFLAASLNPRCGTFLWDPALTRA